MAPSDRDFLRLSAKANEPSPSRPAYRCRRLCYVLPRTESRVAGIDVFQHFNEIAGQAVSN